jgi:hypothetical protein
MVDTPWFPVEVTPYPMISTGKGIEFSYAEKIENKNKFSR